MSLLGEGSLLNSTTMLFDEYATYNVIANSTVHPYSSAKLVDHNLTECSEGLIPNKTVSTLT